MVEMVGRLALLMVVMDIYIRVVGYVLFCLILTVIAQFHTFHYLINSVTCLSRPLTHLFIYLFTYLLIYLFTYLLIYLFTYLLMYA